VPRSNKRKKGRLSLLLSGVESVQLKKGSFESVVVKKRVSSGVGSPRILRRNGKKGIRGEKKTSCVV
jgi:hypothetical protein